MKKLTHQVNQAHPPGIPKSEKEQTETVTSSPPENSCHYTDKLQNELKKLNIDDCFTDQFGTCYISLNVSEPTPHREIHQLKSQRTIDHLTLKTVFQSDRKNERVEFNKLIRCIEAYARTKEPQTIWNRFAFHEAAVWIDLVDTQWRAIRITNQEWKVVTTPPVLFRRHAHQQALPIPQREGNFKNLLYHLSPMSEKMSMMCLIWTVLACFPQFPRPMLVPIGPHGAAKSTFCRRLRSLLDPSHVPLLGEDDRRDLMLIFRGHAIPTFDNLCTLSRKEADLFCRAVTGAGISRRKLFTDTDDVIFQFRKAIMLNGITLPSNRPDFLERCVVLELGKLKKYEPEEKLDATFKRALPRMFGGLLDVMVSTMERVKTVSTSGINRMADFARYGRATALALGKTEEDFDRAYREVMDSQNRGIIENNYLALTILEMMNDQKEPIETNMKDLYEKLTTTAKNNNLKSENWPKDSTAMSKRLTELAPTLKMQGITITKLPRKDKIRSRWRFNNFSH